uniref:Oxysterol-binding protein n=1 Tax=Angiostrongylus cantonensis TaxID=6313 RepID=A0A0K0DA15_ANGCA
MGRSFRLFLKCLENFVLSVSELSVSDKGGELVVIPHQLDVETTEKHLEDASLYPPSSEKEFKSQANTEILYLLIKTHKLVSSDDLVSTDPSLFKVRPIISCVDGPTDRITWLITLVLTQLLKYIPAHLTNTQIFLDRLRNAQPYNAWSGRYYAQMRWLAMAQRLAPSHAIAYMSKVEAPVIDLGPLLYCSLSVEDQEFLHRNSTSLSIDPTRSTIHPKILLGNGDVQKVLDKGIPLNNTLPLGLTLIPSRLGYLVTGATYKQQKEPGIGIVLAASTTEVSYAITESEENPWVFESPADNEFMGSNKEELQQQNTAIWKQFQETIEKREDGYYVRLPWKNDATTLPDNEAMAVKRLQAIITKIKQDYKMLQEYDETIASQLHQNIIEEVDESKPSDGSIIHYLPPHAAQRNNENKNCV